jgi:hypothetical protein
MLDSMLVRDQSFVKENLRPPYACLDLETKMRMASLQIFHSMKRTTAVKGAHGFVTATFLIKSMVILSVAWFILLQP